VQEFVAKLFRIVNDHHTNGIIEWGTDNTYFVIHDMEEFTQEILMHEFKALIYQSFRRQLNTYGFFRQIDKEKNGEVCYANPWFRKDNPDQLWRI
jgi:hypothetical protein